MSFRRGFFVIALVGASLALSACASMGGAKAPAPDAYDVSLVQAEQQVSAGNVDAALAAFADAARADDARKEPWVRIAQLQFDRGNYVEAMSAAQEVLKRDPEDLVADGVITVSGLRVAQESLRRLQGSGALSSATARNEARSLVNTLRETMGAGFGEPEPEPAAARPASRRASTPRSRAPAQSRPARQSPAPAATPRPTTPSRNPFERIGGN